MKIYCQKCMCEHETTEHMVGGTTFNFIHCPKNDNSKPFIFIPAPEEPKK